MEVRIGKEVFKAKKDLLARLKEMLHAAPLGVELDLPQHEFLMELLKRHPEAKKKIGPGVKAFRVTTSEFKNRCFEVIREDGTETDFSYLKCVSEKTAWSEFTHALRDLVKHQVWEAKEKVFLWDEVITLGGETVTREETRVEYLSPDTFGWLAEEFSLTEKLDKNNLPLGPSPDGGKVLVDPALEARWQAFHEKRAKFEILSESEHKKRKSKQTVTSDDTQA
jgi:hypothetical protein